MYCKQLPLYILLLLNLPLQYWMFVCAASITYKVAFILISTGTPTEENHNIFSICCFFFYRYWLSQDSKGKQGTILFSSLYHFTNIQTFICSFSSCLIHTNIYVLGKQEYTMAIWYIVYITKKAFVGANRRKKGGSREALLTQPLLFQFFNVPLKK